MQVWDAREGKGGVLFHSHEPSAGIMNENVLYYCSSGKRQSLDRRHWIQHFLGMCRPTPATGTTRNGHGSIKALACVCVCWGNAHRVHFTSMALTRLFPIEMTSTECSPCACPDSLCDHALPLATWLNYVYGPWCYSEAPSYFHQHIHARRWFL